MRFGYSTNIIISINFVVGTGVLDCPISCKCYFAIGNGASGRSPPTNE